MTKSPHDTLRRLFLTLFLRGRGARGLTLHKAPRAIWSKLWMILAAYSVMGAVAFVFSGRPVFELSLYLHAMTFVILGMYIASSAGEVLFNKEEADILMHRPIAPRTVLWAKVAMLIEVSLWLAGCFNAIGLVVGFVRPSGTWLYLVAHVTSVGLAALFCTGCVVLTYQLCLKWFGRERLEGLMTAVQVLFSVGIFLTSQIAPRLIRPFGRLDGMGQIGLDAEHWWLALLPPAWFAGFDDALAGGGGTGAWILAALGTGVTAVVLSLAFGKLAAEYEAGLQTLNETISRPRTRSRWIDTLVRQPPLKWWLRDSVSRASFLLTAAYLVRDRDVKLRVYPALAPTMVMPFIMLFGPGMRGEVRPFGVTFAGAFMSLVPFMALGMIKHSQQWQAADLFRVVPVGGPAALMHGARRAVLACLAAPVVALFAVVILVIGRDPRMLLLLIPGVMAMPLIAMIPCLGGSAVPLSAAVEETKAASRPFQVILTMAGAVALGAAASFAWEIGWFWPFVAIETIVAAIVYVLMRAVISRLRWDSLE